MINALLTLLFVLLLGWMGGVFVAALLELDDLDQYH